MNKFFGIGLLAALAIAPSAAFAQQTSVTTQQQDQEANVVGVGNTVVQQGNQFAHTRQLNINKRLYCSGGSQVAATVQNQSQKANVAGAYNTVAQIGNQAARTAQTQISHGFGC
jgi:hypothetical protein